METVTISREEYRELKRLSAVPKKNEPAKRNLCIGAFGILKKSIPVETSSVAYVIN